MKKVLLGLAIILNICSFSYALETDTHEAISEHISKSTLNNFSLDSYLKAQLGIQEGIEESFNSKKVWRWLRDGGLKEDIPAFYLRYIRSLNHFHNPLTEEGFKGNCLESSLCVSATVWALEPLGTQSSITGNYSWYDVRDYYSNALTATSQVQRDSYFIQTFRGLGQLMHLVTDMSVPAHTRDDFHYSYNYENWVDENAKIADYTPIFFNGTVINMASLMDTNTYTQYSDPIITSNITTGADGTLYSSIGLSEYTNANFFSEDTITNGFTYPKIDQNTTLAEVDQINSIFNTTYVREYYKKNCCGETNNGNGYLLYAVDYLDYYRQLPPFSSSRPIHILDEKVYKDYASLLLPRAVGYSASLLQYFFRGNIEITLPNSGVYSQSENPAQGFTGIKVLARNITQGSEAMTNGTVQLVVKYRLALEDPFQPKPVPTTDEFFYIVVPEANGVSSIPVDAPAELTFDLSQSPIPMNATDLYLQVVFKGTLGLEANAVAVGFKDISEPTPVDVWNNMDRVCLNGAWYVAGSPEAIAQVDTNHDGIAWGPQEGDVYAHDLRNVYVRFSPSLNPLAAFPTEYNFNIPSIPATPGGTYSRGYVITDYDFRGSPKLSVINTNLNDYWVTAFPTYIYRLSAIKNQTDNEPSYCLSNGVNINPCYVRKYPIYNNMRGVYAWGLSSFSYENEAYPSGSKCQ